MQYLPPRPPAEIISHYVLWLHNVEEKKEKQEEISLKTLTPKHKKVLKVAGCTVQCATQQLNPGLPSGCPPRKTKKKSMSNGLTNGFIFHLTLRFYQTCRLRDRPM